MPGPLEDLRKIIRDGRGIIHKAGDGIRGVASEMRGFAGATTETTPSGATAPNEPPSSSLTYEELLAYQNREIAKELWALEKHLSQGCRIPNKQGILVPCDCCEKGTFIAGLAYEAIPMAERFGQPSEIHQKIAKWCESLGSMATVTAVESGQYDYKKLSGEASALRKELMGTTSLAALRSPTPELSLEEAKRIAAEEAARTVEQRWGSVESSAPEIEESIESGADVG